MEVEIVYCRRRLAEEQAAAIHASHAKARAAHLEMSAAYEARLRALEATAEDKPPLRLVDVA